MTDYIEEMMKTAGVEPTITYFAAVNPYSETSLAKSVTEKRSFTPEKQLEIIKLIATNKIGEDYRNIAFDKDEINDKWYFSVNIHKKVNAYISNNLDFSQALAQLTTELMKAGELDKEKVKEILEDDKK